MLTAERVDVGLLEGLPPFSGCTREDLEALVVADANVGVLRGGGGPLWPATGPQALRPDLGVGAVARQPRPVDQARARRLLRPAGAPVQPSGGKRRRRHRRRGAGDGARGPGPAAAGDLGGVAARLVELPEPRGRARTRPSAVHAEKRGRAEVPRAQAGSRLTRVEVPHDCARRPRPELTVGDTAIQHSRIWRYVDGVSFSVASFRSQNAVTSS